MHSTAQQTQRQQWRARLIAQRQQWSGHAAASARLQQVLLAWLAGGDDGVVGAYWPIRGEFDPLPALLAWQRGDAPPYAATSTATATATHSACDAGAMSDVMPDTISDAISGAMGASRASGASTASRTPMAARHGHTPYGGDVLPHSAHQQHTHRQIALPVVDAASKTLRFHHWYAGCTMGRDAYGIPYPLHTAALVPMLLLVPCVGYGPGGVRLGYGGGFYDRTLAAGSASMSSSPPRPFTVGLAFAHSLIPDLHPQPHDVPLDVILTEDGLVHSTTPPAIA